MAEAERVLTMMNGAAKAQDPSQRAVRLAGRFQSEDGRQHVVAGTVTMRARATLAAAATGGVPIEPPPPPAREWQAFASANENVADVLRLLAPDDLDWMVLYKVVEIIKADVGGGKTKKAIIMGKKATVRRGGPPRPSRIPSTPQRTIRRPAETPPAMLGLMGPLNTR